MSGVLTLAATIAAAAGAVAAYRFVDRKQREFSDMLKDVRRGGAGKDGGTVIDYERDEDGVYRPRD